MKGEVELVDALSEPLGPVYQRKLCRWPFSGQKNGVDHIKMYFHDVGHEGMGLIQWQALVTTAANRQ
jgi:hypothetical protein